MKLKHIRLIKKAIVLSILIILAIILQVVKTNKIIAEHIFARGISRAFVYVFGSISNAFPFSLFEVFIFITLVFLVFYLIIIIKALKKRRHYKVTKILLNIGIFVLIFVNVYTLSAGGNYYRDKAKINAYLGTQLSLEQTTNIIEYFLEDYNQITDSLIFDANKSICPYSYKEVTKLLMKEFDKFSDDYGNFYNGFTPRPKKAMFSFFMSFEGISGISFLPTGEANINYQVPQCFRIVTMAHEMSHIKGVMTEREANMIAYYILINSDVPYFRYCGYMYGLSSLTSLLYYYDTKLYSEVYSSYPSKALLEQQSEYAFWQAKSSFIEDISTFINDLYLKINGNNEGVYSYYDISVVTPPIEENLEPVIYYSDTVRMLIAIGQSHLPY